MKTRTFFEKLNKQGKINNEDANKAIASLPEDHEIPDVWVNLFEENFLTRERAASDFELTKKIKAESLNGVDEKFKAILPLLDAGDREILEKEINTYKKVESLPGAIQKLLDKAKSENPNLSEEVKLKEKKILELADSISALKKEYETGVKTIQQKHEQEKSDLRVDWNLERKIGGLTFADEFSNTADKKTQAINFIKFNVKNGNILREDEQGEIRIYEIKDGQPSLKFNGNEQVTIDGLLQSAAEPFLKKNNGDGGNGGNTQQRTQQPRTVQKPNTNGQQPNFPPKARANTPTV